jgi:hypothetical protein
MTKGRNTFDGYQQANQEGREKLIDQYLEQLAKSRVKFKHVTGLADMVAMHIARCEQLANSEQRPCNKATLLRNNRYKALLLTFMAAHLGAGTKSLKFKDIGDDKSKSLVATAQLEAANLRREVDRMKRYIAHLDEKRDAPHRAGTQAGTDTETAKLQEALLETQLKHTRTCQALFTLLNHFSQTVSADVEQQRILDLSRLRNNVIVDSRKAAPFFEWLAANKGIG